MNAPTGAVFLSYASQDAAAAKLMSDALRAAGIEVWFDQAELRGGEIWDRKITEQIHQCRLFMPVISENTEARDEGYFRREWGVAVDRMRDMAEHKAFLVPVVIDGTGERQAAVPDRFRHVQWMKLPGGAPTPTFVNRIAALLGASNPNMSPEGAARVASGIPEPREPARRSIGVGVGALLLTVALGGGWLAWRHLGSHPVSASAADKSIAVLPFVDLSEKQDQAYLADGLAEEVIDLLAGLPGLKVIGRTSSFQFRGRQLDVRAIGAELGVAHVLEGSVRRSGDKVRVTAQLLNTHDGAHEWSETYDSQLDDVLKVQDAIAANLSRALEVAVDEAQIPIARMVSPAAYDLFLRGIHALDPFTKEGCQEAIGLFTQSLQIDPAFAPASVGTAWAYDDMGQNGWLPTPVAFERARASALRALELDPKIGAAHTILADVHLVYDWDWAAAERQIEQAFALGGRNAAGLTVAARIASTLDPASDKAASLLHEAIALDPLNAEAHMILGWWVYAHTGRFAEAERSMRRALQISPHWGSGHYFLAVDLLMLGRTDDALVEAASETLDDGQLEASAEIFYAQHRTGDSDAALAKATARNGDDWASAIARVYAFRGEADKAIQWLERAYSQHDEDLYFIKGDPILRVLESDPRYKAFLRKMKLPE